MGAAHEYLLPVDDVVVALPIGRRLDIGQVRPGLRLRQQLPCADFALEDGRQELLFLLVAAPNHDGRATESAPRIVIRRDSQANGVHLLVDHHGMVKGETAPAVLRRSSGPQPALGAHPPAQFPALLILLRGDIGGVRWMQDAVGHVVFQPPPDLLAKLFLLRRVTRFKIHGFPP